MKKYSKKLIEAYINGDDIGDVNLDLLEEDPYFMSQAICYAKDLKMYDLCSKQVKCDYDFVKTLITTFAVNTEFIVKVAKYYLDNSKNLTKEMRWEINILLVKYLKDHFDEDYIEASVICDNYYQKELKVYQKVYQSYDEKDENKQIFGLGFQITLMEYQNSILIKQYIASRMIEDIFTKTQEFCLENYLHQKYSKEEILTKKINNVLIDYIMTKDVFLAGYVCQYPHLIADLKERTAHLMFRWDYFKEAYEEALINNILDLISEFYDENMFEVSFLEADVIGNIAHEFNLLAQFAKYDSNFALIANLVANYVAITPDNVSFKIYAAYEALKKKIRLLLRGEVLDGYTNDPKEGKVIQLKREKTQK